LNSDFGATIPKGKYGGGTLTPSNFGFWKIRIGSMRFVKNEFGSD
jgi:hypothetical protein